MSGGHRVHCTLALAAVSICFSARGEHSDPRIEALIANRRFEALAIFAAAEHTRILTDPELAPGDRLVRLYQFATELYNDDRIELADLEPAMSWIVESGRMALDAAITDTMVTQLALQDATTLLRRDAQYEEAARLATRRIQILDAVSSSTTVDRDLARVSLAKVHYEAGRFEDAIQLVAPRIPAIRASLESVDPRSVADALNLIAVCKRPLGDLRESVNLHLEAHELLERAMREQVADRDEMQSRREQWLVQTYNLATAYIDQDQLRGAELCFREIERACMEEPCSGRRRMQYRRGLASVARRQLRFDEAEQMLREFLSELPSLKGVSRADFGLVLDELGWVQRDRGNFAIAAHSFSAALDSMEGNSRVMRSTGPMVMRRLAEAQGLLGQRDKAHASFQSALAAREAQDGEAGPALGVVLTSYADWLVASGQRDPDPAALLDRAIALMETDPLLISYRADALATRARLYWSEGDAAAAVSTMEASLRDVEVLRAVSGFDPADRARVHSTRLDDFQDLMRWHIALGNESAALRTSERGRARSLLDEFNPTRGIENRPAQSKPTSPELTSAERAVWKARMELLATSERSGELLRTYDRAYRNLLVARAELEGVPHEWANEEFASLDQARELLRKDELLLSYFDSGKSLTLIVVRGDRTGLDWLELADATRNESILADRLSDGTEPFDAELSTQLKLVADRLLPAALRAELESRSLVFVIPAGILHRLPMTALVLEAGTSALDTKFWVDVMPPVHYLPSLSSWDRSRRRERNRAREPERALIVADPELVGRSGIQELGRLRFSKREASTLEQRLPNSRTLRGSAATETNFVREAPHASLIHLATHGVIDSRARTDVATLILSEGDPQAGRSDDGLLDLDEIEALSLNARLTVLSACSTQRGEFVLGEGSFALSRAFLRAGSAQTLGTLWPVEDYATAWFMERFYDEYLNDEESKRMAARPLLRVQRRMRAQDGWEDPVHWGAFVLSGLR